MAELLSVLLEKLFEEVLSKLTSAAENELRLLFGVEKEKQKLGSNMSRITAVLQDAESGQVLKESEKDWLRKLKNAVYDVEDLLDELVVEDRRRKVENEDGIGKKARNFFSPLNPLCFRSRIAHKIQELRERLDALAKEKEDFPSLAVFELHQSLISDDGRETGPEVIQSEVYGRKYEKKKLVNLLMNSENEKDLSVIAIVAMGGLGKTTLAQLVYNDEKVMAQFQLSMWVYVSDRDLNVKGLLRKILGCTNNDTPDQLVQLQNRVREKLSGKRYLLVLDDVWNEDPSKWDKLRTMLKCGAIGSKILVTTRSETVASIMDALPIGLPILSDDESWTLFDQVAKPPACFVSIGKDIVKKCGGVPLAIKTLGGMLLNEPSETEWQSVRDSELWKTQDDDGVILPALRLSYDHLTSSLKQCFAYCAVIPKGRRFNKDVLIKQWIAQGFIHSDDEHALLEEDGEKQFNKLVRRSLFQVVVDNDSYKMHDLIHDLFRAVARKECFVVEASMMNDLTPHLALCNDETRHLALCNNEWEGETKNSDALRKCKKLRSMITYGYFRPIDSNVCWSFRCLRVLDLSFRRSIHFLPNSIDKLRHLRYFDISGTRITELPETICNLHNLQTLRVLQVRLQKWPENMKRMISLRHIEFDGGEDFPLPKGIGELTFLRTLPKSKFIIAKESGARIEELKGLNLLWGNIHIGGLDNIGSVGCAGEADLKAKKHLNSLKLSWSGDEIVAAEGNAKEVIEVLEPHSYLKELSVENYTGLEFPSWMMKKLTMLNKISLSSCNRCEHLPPLGQLPFLESLEIDRMNAVKYIVQFDGSRSYEDLFPSLKDLHLRYMPNLERWSSPQEDGNGDKQGRERDKQVIFKCLRTLRIDHCPKLTRPPRLLLPSLESLEVGGIGWDMIEIPTSQSLMEVKLDKMPNLERWSPHEADDGTPMIFHSIRTLSISYCPKLICLPMFLLPALEELKLREVGWESIEFSRSHSLEIVDLFDMPNLERWSLQEVDDDKDEQVTFGSLCTLRISRCPKLIWLPQLLLPALEDLEMEGVGCEKIAFSASKSLKKVELTEMPNLERWSPQEADDDKQVVFDRLLELVVKECPRMVRLPHFLPSLEKLEISRSNEMLLVSVVNYTSLSELSIHALPEVKHLPEEFGPNHTSLRELRISKCPKLISLSNQLENLLALKELIVGWGCNDLVLSLPDGLQQQQQRSPPLNSLEVLEIYNSCEKQTSLPGDGIVLPSLKELRICSCRNMESLSADMLKNLTKLSIQNSSKVWSSLVSLENLKSLEILNISGCPKSVMMKMLESMENLTSLTSLWIEDCPDLRSLPKSVKTFTSLTRLKIDRCPVMRSLPEWVGDLTLLRSLYIYGCPGMTSLPEGLQRLQNLRWLEIHGCPVLERRVQRNKGQGWHKVAHVGYINIDRAIVSDDTEGEESSDQCPHLLLHSLKKLEKLLPLASCCSSSPSSSSSSSSPPPSPPST